MQRLYFLHAEIVFTFRLEFPEPLEPDPGTVGDFSKRSIALREHPLSRGEKRAGSSTAHGSRIVNLSDATGGVSAK